DYTLKLAVFHTIFNAIGIIVMVPFISKLADSLERWLSEPEPVYTKPKFLNDAATDFADAAIEAARLETIRLYRKATKIIAHGLGVKRKDALGAVPLEELDEHGRKIEDELDQRYSQSIKSLYGAIVEFITRAQRGMRPESVDEIFAIRFAGRQIVEAVKGVGHLQKNFKAHLASDNEDLRDSYLDIRKRIVRLVRELEAVRQEGEGELAILTLDNAKIAAKREDIVANGKLDELIRKERISVSDATSLINDNGYAYGICKNLIVMARILFAVHDDEEREAEESLALDDEEVATLSDTIVDDGWWL
ncbi:MAG: Na/Pi cotransporter family protein, partial [Deltaproteobacteria bacterium]|nr:Na/Pi cotransporter family protein [Deltaproteobacteria bacterium]